MERGVMSTIDELYEYGENICGENRCDTCVLRFGDEHNEFAGLCALGTLRKAAERLESERGRWNA
jgi:hypothetical protein